MSCQLTQGRRASGAAMDSGYARLPGEDAEAHCARLLQLLQGGATPEEDEGSNEAEGLEVAEAMLAQKSTEKQSPMVLELLKNLQQCAVPGMRLDAACCTVCGEVDTFLIGFWEILQLIKGHVVLYVVGGLSFLSSISWTSFLSTFCLTSCPECSYLKPALILWKLLSDGACEVYTDTPNSETNRKLWNAYAHSCLVFTGFQDPRQPSNLCYW